MRACRPSFLHLSPWLGSRAAKDSGRRLGRHASAAGAHRLATPPGGLVAVQQAEAVFLSFKYRLHPNKRQHAALMKTLEDQRLLYNAALEERIGCYQKTGNGRSYIDQCAALTEWRADDAEAANVPLNIQRWTLKRVDDAFKGFFARAQSRHGKAGFPRYRSRERWNSFGFNQFSGIRFDEKRLRWRGLPGALRVHLHRALPSNNVRSCILSRDTKGWAISLIVAAPRIPRRDAARAIGIDIGITSLATLSDGSVIPNVRPFRKASKALRRRQRALARCKRNSARRRKVRKLLARTHTKIANTRRTHLHQASAKLVRDHNLIAIEKLNVKGFAGSRIAKSVHDAGWGIFLGMLRYKAERVGGEVIEVPARNTSQECSGCGTRVPKTLATRTHHCPSCGVIMDRDENAARNILARAVVRPGLGNVVQQGERRAGNIASEEFSERFTTSEGLESSPFCLSPDARGAS